MLACSNGPLERIDLDRLRAVDSEDIAVQEGSSGAVESHSRIRKRGCQWYSMTASV